MPYKGPLSVLLASAALFVSQAALAAEGDKADETEKKSDAEATTKSGSSDIWDTKEDPHKTYRYIGARYRHAIVPKFVLNWFVDGGATTNVPMGGLEFGQRRDHIEYIVSLSYADYSKSNMLFKAKGDLETAYEKVDSEMAIIFGKIEILYDIPLDDKSRWSLLVGGGVGIGGVFGKLKRRQVYPNQPGGSGDDPNEWNDCAGPGAAPLPVYCAEPNDHFGNYEEPSWASGGSKPFVFPWLAVPHVALRYKPIKNFQARLDLGLALTTGFYFGLGLDYIL